MRSLCSWRRLVLWWFLPVGFVVVIGAMAGVGVGMTGMTQPNQQQQQQQGNDPTLLSSVYNSYLRPAGLQHQPEIQEQEQHLVAVAKYNDDSDTKTTTTTTSAADLSFLNDDSSNNNNNIVAQRSLQSDIPCCSFDYELPTTFSEENQRLNLTYFTPKTNQTSYRLLMMNGREPFHDMIWEGFVNECQEMSLKYNVNITCDHIVENYTWFEDVMNYNYSYHVKPCVPQLRLVLEEQLDNNSIIHPPYDGMAVKCNLDRNRHHENGLQLFDEIQEAGIPIITFDGPHPDVAYHGWVGTDNEEMGRSMARLLRQLRPEVQTGNFVVTYNGPTAKTRAEAFRQEITKHNMRPDKPHWHEIVGGPDDPLLPDLWIHASRTNHYMGNPLVTMERLERIASVNPTALLFFYTTPMQHPNYTAWVQRHAFRNITLIGLAQGTRDDEFVHYLTRGLVDGLVGQRPWDMGQQAARHLFKAVVTGNDPRAVPLTTYTGLVHYNLVPERLPDPAVNQHLLGGLKWIGWTCFVVTASLAIFCIVWSIWHRRNAVVKASQPFFLVLTATGVLVMSGALVPLSFDDADSDAIGGSSKMSDTKATAVCMSIPWLAFTGYTISMSALFSKTWRINHFFRSNSAFARIRVTERDVLAPFIVLVTINLIILLCWTLWDPLKFERRYLEGTDVWNREIESVGRCRSDHPQRYLAPLGVGKFILNVAVLALGMFLLIWFCSLASRGAISNCFLFPVCVY